MSESERESRCTYCIHRPVCTYKETYMSIFKAACDLIEPYDFITSISVNCAHYSLSGSYNARTYSIGNAETGATKA